MTRDTDEFDMERARRAGFDKPSEVFGNDHDLLIRIHEIIKRVVSDAESEKRTRASTNRELFEKLGQIRGHIDDECRHLHDRIDEEREKLSEYMNRRDETHGSQIKWLERMAWFAIGAIGFAKWLIN